MPACRDCHCFNGSCCIYARFHRVNPDYPWMNWNIEIRRVHVRSCRQGIFYKHLPSIAGQVLEVGSGVSKQVRKDLWKTKRCNTFCVDPKYLDRPDIQTYKGTVGNLPFDENTFDWVLTFECIEHWEEYGETIPQGIREIFRVLKPGGKLLASAPFHVHGSDAFVFGNAEQVQAWVRDSAAWESCMFEEWRREYEPLPKLENWRTLKQSTVDKLLSAYPGGPSCWSMEIFCTK